ncbi:hypothetical protein J2W30_004560 [Variovorax boronicumulans]|uniref:hypothetical protein n=1 Tax=Variovorax boronicumulans TaxID=436515 RepID=UPI002787EC4F|nr:hypothetical protein [Variovorax boronicumulans]MDQ0036785.1 hypothetical protein [Variovorax boronicumulans]
MKHRFRESGAKVLPAIAGAKHLVRVVEPIDPMLPEIGLTGISSADALELLNREILGLEFKR